ncbi:T9SS type A sorting domain-containing protein [Flavobacterium sp.]|uniref:T9SS type A sorting domain-containing protein n=1 Tax=Flavobacterium sp. TaxID=239 RepID=UPI003751C800
MKKQYKLLLLFFILTSFFKGYSQQYEINLSPEGKLETVYDNRGNLLKLKDILIDAPKDFGYLKTTTVTCSTTSYFNLYFEPGCGMEDTSNPTQNARRAVLCKVFEDISNFITSPLSTTGNKVNIWVRNIANVNVPTGTLGLASSFYIPYANSTNTIGGILDGEIWKTIHTGVDSYTNISSATNTFYHGEVSFNFDPSISWNTNLTVNTPSNMYDLYTVMLHEIVHSLGFGSFINQNGASIDPSPYFSRYDTFLRTNTNVPLLTIGSCSMYDISFNSSVSPTVLRPGCTLPNNLSTGVLNTTVCNNAIKYVGSSTVPVYTPTCFELGSSLSHFEDMLYPTCATPYVNDNYFVLSNVNLIGTTKRYLKPEERKVLCDIGYNVKTTFGSATTSTGYYNYGGTVCTGISVAGVNDGINSTTGAYTFTGSIATTGATSTSVSISGLLSNDVNTTSFECLQDITAPTTSTIVNTFGTNATISTFTTSTPGLHLLRYIPINGTKRGNITYLYVYIIPPYNPGECAPAPNTCDLVMNGNFEQYSSLPTNNYQIIKACVWNSPTSVQGWTPSYFNSGVIPGSTPNAHFADIPCNAYGFQDCKNNIGNGYADIYRSEHDGRKHLLTKLKMPLQANTNYQLSFDVSLHDGRSNFGSNIQAYLSVTANATLDPFTIELSNITNPNMLLTSSSIVRNSTGWETLTFNFTTSIGGEEYLYLGLLKNLPLVLNTPSMLVPNCSYNNTTSLTLSSFERPLGYYIDNVSLIPTNGAVLNLPTSICSTQNLSDLSLYISGTTANGVFSGTGVTLASGIYSFNASVAGVGTTTIGYTFTNSSGCTTTLYDTITISTTSSNTIVVDAINDNFSSPPIIGASGGVTTSVYANDLYNGTASSSASLPNVTFALVPPLSIAGATINSSGLISIPAGTLAGTYTLTYRLSVVGNCTTSDTATVTILVINSNSTPNLVAGIRANNAVNLIELQSTNKSIISGYFTTYNNLSTPRITRLNTDLTLDQTFVTAGPNPTSYPPNDMVIQSDDKIIVTGGFSGFSGGSNGFGIARLLANGAIDTSYNVGGAGTAINLGYTNNIPYGLAIQSDNKILLGGDFYYYNGIQRLGIVKINTNGTIDTSFVPTELNSYYRSVVTGITIQPDGKIILLGFFSPPTAGATQKNIIRLNANGTIDTTFLAGDTLGSLSYNGNLGVSLYSPLARAVVQPDGKIIIAGAFDKYNGTNVKCLVRLTATGSIDTSFNITTGVERAINELILEPTTNKLIIGGEFTVFGVTAVKKLIRLTTTGTLDTTFSIGTGTTDSTSSSCFYCLNYIKALKQQPDGKIIVGGKFTTFNGLSATNITRIFGDAGVQAKNSIAEYQSEPEIDTNPNFSAITIYPNPSKGIYNIDLSDVKEPTTITVFNILGELVFKQLLTPQSQNQIDITNLSNGYYIARIVNQSFDKQQKLIKN